MAPLVLRDVRVGLADDGERRQLGAWVLVKLPRRTRWVATSEATSFRVYLPFASGLSQEIFPSSLPQPNMHWP